MTNSEFWKLWDNKELENVSIWRKAEQDIDPEFADFRNEVVAFAYNGKFFLRIVQFNGYDGSYSGNWGNRKFTKKAVRTYSAIKEFDNKNSANAYFKKCAAGYKKEAA